MGLLFDVVIHGLVFTKQKHTAAVGLPMQQGSRKHSGVSISEQGYKINSSLKAVLAAADRQLWENVLARDGKDREDLNKVSSGLQISHELPHLQFCMWTNILTPGLFLYLASSEQGKTKLSWIQSQAPVLSMTTHPPSSTGIQGSSCRVQRLWETACIGEAKLRDTSKPAALEAIEGGTKKSCFFQCKQEQDPFSWQQPKVITAQLGQHAAGLGSPGTGRKARGYHRGSSDVLTDGDGLQGGESVCPSSMEHQGHPARAVPVPTAAPPGSARGRALAEQSWAELGWAAARAGTGHISQGKGRMLCCCS